MLLYDRTGRRGRRPLQNAGGCNVYFANLLCSWHPPSTKNKRSVATFFQKGLAISQRSWYNNLRRKNATSKICTVCIVERYIAYGDDSLTLRLVSKLPDLRVANAKWIQWASSLSLVESSSIIVMHTCASQLWRDIEVVITGLTRNFVVTLEPPTLNPLIYKGFPQFK